MHVTFWFMLFRSRCRNQPIAVFQSFVLSWCPGHLWSHVETIPSVVSLEKYCHCWSRLARRQVYHLI